MRIQYNGENYRVRCLRRAGRRQFLAEKFDAAWKTLPCAGPSRIFVAARLKAALRMAQTAPQPVA